MTQQTEPTMTSRATLRARLSLINACGDDTITEDFLDALDVKGVPECREILALTHFPPAKRFVMLHGAMTKKHLSRQQREELSVAEKEAKIKTIIHNFVETRDFLELEEQTENWVFLLYDEGFVIPWLKELCACLPNSLEAVKDFYDDHLSHCDDAYDIEMDELVGGWERDENDDDDLEIRRGRGMTDFPLLELNEMLARHTIYRDGMMETNPHQLLRKIEQAGENIANLMGFIAVR
tara:strand:+ start:527 stop:1237 length:711 start_codon:yes stop_codon:yes gene_type:complete